MLYSNPVKPAGPHRRGVAGRRVAVRLRLARASWPSSPSSARRGGLRAARAPDQQQQRAQRGQVRRRRRRRPTCCCSPPGLGLRPYGVTFHVGSQMLDPAAWDARCGRPAQVMRELAADGIRLEMLDLGGGFPARYADADRRRSTEYRARRSGRHAATCPTGRSTLAVEPGRALVAEAGVMVATVIGIAERRGRRWVHLDVGAFNGFMEALETGNRLRFPVTDSRAVARRARRAHLTGPTCDSQDTIMFDVPLSVDLAVDDRVLPRYRRRVHDQLCERLQRLRRADYVHVERVPLRRIHANARRSRRSAAYCARAMATAPSTEPDTQADDTILDTIGFRVGRWLLGGLAGVYALATLIPSDDKPDLVGHLVLRGRDPGGDAGRAGPAAAGQAGPAAVAAARAGRDLLGRGRPVLDDHVRRRATRSRCPPRPTPATSRSTRSPRSA